MAPKVSVVVVPRERFCFAKRSLQSLLDNTEYPHQLVYVDNKSPRRLKRFLSQQAGKGRMEICRSDYYRSPNACRNLGLLNVAKDSEYICFVDNDVVFERGWLEKLVDAAEETQATAVAPLVCQWEPVHKTIHCAGGDYLPEDEKQAFIEAHQSDTTTDDARTWELKEHIYRQGEKVDEVKHELQRGPVDFVEYHCVMIRADFFEQNGMLDERFQCTKEYIDLAMTIATTGGQIVLEPTSIVTFLSHPPAPAVSFEDMPFFALRWSDAWEHDSLKHFQSKWNLATSKYFERRYSKLGWRRRVEIIRPILDTWLPFVSKDSRRKLEKNIGRWEKRRNQSLTKRYAERYPLVSELVSESQANDRCETRLPVAHHNVLQ
jgi:GT2 family glycosyltransferase